MMTMRSAVFQGVGKPLAIEIRPIPVPGPHQALIRVERCGICASDLHMTAGHGFDAPAGTALGHEYAGEVVETGSAVSGLKAGDRVTAVPMSGCGTCPACIADTPLHCPHLVPMMGGYSDYALIDARRALRLPSSMDADAGALVEPLASALRGVNKIGLEPGARVAVLGAGAMGLAAAYWARRQGAGPIAVIARSRRSEAVAATMGADGFATLGGDMADQVGALLGGAADVVIEGAGVPGVLQDAIGLVRTGGTILSLGGCMQPDPILPVAAMYKEVRLIFSVAYGLRDFRSVIDGFDGGAFAPAAMIGDRIGLHALPTRFEAMRGGSPAIKVMVEPQRDAPA